MSEMMERVAKAVHQTFASLNYYPLDFIEATHIARAAILAMREPTAMMGYHGLNATDCLDRERPGAVSDVWRAMIDEALK